ncbi:MAG: hypothetical protein WCL25_01575 [bacterium]
MKIRYEVDPHNRLIAARSKKESALNKYREILEGRFSIDKHNSLIYHLKRSSDFSLPQQIKFQGRWSLNNQHDLVLTLDKWNNQCQGDKLVISCNIISVKADELVFSAMTRDTKGEGHFYLLKLTGSWQADVYNRLSFSIEKEMGPTQRLTLECAWEVDRSNKLVYNYTKQGLKRKDKLSQSITFQGYWDIIDKHRISYIISRELDSLFDFQASFEKPLKNSLQYQIGIGINNKKRTLKIFGSWKANKKLGVCFEAKQEGKKIQNILLSTSYAIDDKHSLLVGLRNRSNKDLGIEVRLSRKFFADNGEAFIQALASKNEKAVSAGAGFRW